MKFNHTGHEVYKCAGVAGHTKILCFNGLIAVTGHLYFICAQFCIIFVFAIYFWICDVRYIYSNVWFQCKTSECLVSFKFLSMSCMGSFQWPFHYKKLLLSNKNICWATYLCSCDLFVSFSRAVNYIFSHTYSSLHSSISVQDKTWWFY